MVVTWAGRALSRRRRALSGIEATAPTHQPGSDIPDGDLERGRATAPPVTEIEPGETAPGSRPAPGGPLRTRHPDARPRRAGAIPRRPDRDPDIARSEGDWTRDPELRPAPRRRRRRSQVHDPIQPREPKMPGPEPRVRVPASTRSGGGIPHASWLNAADEVPGRSLASASRLPITTCMPVPTSCAATSPPTPRPAPVIRRGVGHGDAFLREAVARSRGACRDAVASRREPWIGSDQSMVGGPGLEPGWIAPHAPQTCASTCSASRPAGPPPSRRWWLSAR